MALTMTKMSLIVIMLGIISFILGIVGENKKVIFIVMFRKKVLASNFYGI
jgi:hypothetical protein